VHALEPILLRFSQRLRLDERTQLELIESTEWPGAAAEGATGRGCARA
jgi:hypothetical protein